MRCAVWSRMICLLGGIGLMGLVFLGGCGSESAKPKPGVQPTPTAQPGVKPVTPEAPPTQPGAKPLTPELPSAQPAPGPEKPITPPPTEKPPKPETKEPAAPETKPSAEKEKASPSEPQSAPAKQEPSPPAEKLPPADVLSPAAPVSSYAPAEDLEAQMEQYLKELQEAVASEEAFKDVQDRLAKDGNTLIVLALALGRHDQPNKYQKAAPALMAAAKELASAKDLASAKKAVEALSAAVMSQGDPNTLKWEKVADLEQLMKAVPLISNKIKDSSLTAARLEKRAKDYAGYAALLAVIAQGSLPHADQTEKPTEVQKWQEFCLKMRAASAELNAAIRAKNSEAALKANARLRQTCDDCHAVFHTKEEKK